MTAWRLLDGASGRPGVGSSGTQPPASPVPNTGPYTTTMAFTVSANGLWLYGYRTWVPPGGDVIPQKFALWENPPGSFGSQALVPGSVVTSGTLTAGAMNFAALPVPIGLSATVFYVAAVGWVNVNGLTVTNNQFGAGNPYSAGITNGPLMAFSDAGGSNGNPTNLPQASFSFTSADAAASMPVSGFQSSLSWLDVDVRDAAPPSPALRLWPSQPVAVNAAPNRASNFTLATEFGLSAPCLLGKIWFYSPPGATVLPSETGIWDTGTQILVAGTHLTSPSWSGAAGSGWVSVSYSGVTLPAGSYKTSVFSASTSNAWSAQLSPYWASPGPGQSGITSGPLSAPGNASAHAPGQASYHESAAFSWPDTHDLPATFWVDVEVTPAPSGSGLLMAGIV